MKLLLPEKIFFLVVFYWHDVFLFGGTVAVRIEVFFFALARNIDNILDLLALAKLSPRGPQLYRRMQGPVQSVDCKCKLSYGHQKLETRNLSNILVF